MPSFAFPFLLLCSLASSILAADEGPVDSVMEIYFPSQDGLSQMQLEGTLRIPDMSADAVPSPGVVLVHGSGPHSRDEVMPVDTAGSTIPVFAEIGSALVGAGIAVLSYDKRTCGTFNGCSNNQYPLPDESLTIDDFIGDALAAVKYLESRPDISSVVVIGHSQAGQFVPILLDSMPSIDGGVLLAAPFRAIDEIIEDQLAFNLGALLAQGWNETAALAALQPIVEMVNGLDAIRQGSDEPVSGSSALFWNSWFDIVPRSLAAAAVVDQPMLILNGLLDANVPPSEAEAWFDYLTTQVNGSDSELVLLPCISHAMNCWNATNISSLAVVTPDDIGKRVDPSVTNVLIDFVRATDAAASAPPTPAPNNVTSGAGQTPYWTGLSAFITVGMLSFSLF